MTQQQHKHWLKLGHSEFELVVPLSPSRSLPTCHCSSENQHWILLRLGDNDNDDQRRDNGDDEIDEYDVLRHFN